MQLLPVKFNRLALHALFVAGLCACLPLQAQSSESLLPNSSLEQADGSGDWPAGWARAKNATWENEDGNRFIRLTSPAPGAHVVLYQKVPLSMEVRALELTFKRRISNFTVGEQQWYDARIIMNFITADGKKVSNKRIPYTRRNSDGWETVTTRFAVPADVVAMEFMPSLFRVDAGTFDLDDVVLKPIDPAEL